jgi:hypothetical protein
MEKQIGRWIETLLAGVVRIHQGRVTHLDIPYSYWFLITVFVLGPVLALPTSLPGQEAHREGLQAIPPDSVELHRAARRAQRDFEAAHRGLLPRGRDFPGTQCDEVVGRLCLSEGDPWWEPSPEDPRVVSEREDLLGILEDVGSQLPGDRWILGQRIRYLGDVGRWEEAEQVARTCQDDGGWWCHGLLGYVLHRSGEVVEALEAFSMALEAMDPERARDWKDPYPLLEYPASRWLRDPEGLTADGAVNRFWALADPLYLTPGNERLSEHLARTVGPSLYDDTALTMGLSWGSSFEQLLTRYGFVAGWERVPREMGETGIRKVVEHHHPESRGLLPPFEALEDPSGLPEGVWTPDDDRPRTASAPVRAPLIAQGQAQTAVLRRGGELLVLAAYGVPTDTVLWKRRVRPDSIRGLDRLVAPDRTPSQRPLWEPSIEGYPPDTLSGLFLVADTAMWAPLVAFGRGGKGVLQVRAPPGGYLLSVEQWCPTGRWGARVRHGLEGKVIPPDVPHLSDLLLLDVGHGLPDSLSEAAPRLRPSTDLRSEGRVTVGWEVYGLGQRGEPLTFSLSLVEEEGSLVRRALKRIGLFRKSPVLTLSWVEDGSVGSGPRFRAIDVDLPRLKAGRYILRLEMKIPYRNSVMSNRRITVF